MSAWFIKFIIFSFIIIEISGGFQGKSVQAATLDQVKAVVKVECFDGQGNLFRGSGTIIDRQGIILTNKHVVLGSNGQIIDECRIGLINSIQEESQFSDEGQPNLARVKYYSAYLDAALLYLYNPNNKVYPYLDIYQADTGALALGETIEILGYPGIGGSTITYTAGVFSGFGSASNKTQNYLKTSASLEHGNSGGTALNSRGEFVGIPSVAVKGSLNSLSYILSVKSIQDWLTDLNFSYNK